MGEILTRGKFRRYPHVDYINQRLVAMARGEIDRAAFAMPPGHSKTSLVSEWNPAWRLALDPTLEIGIGSYNIPIALKIGYEVRRIVREFMPELGIEIEEDSKSVSHWRTSEGGRVVATSLVGGSWTSHHFHLIIIDDPVKGAEQAESPTYKEKVWDEYTRTIQSRLYQGGAICIVQTRWAIDDLMGRVLRQEPDRYELVQLPALAEENDPLGRAEGDALCPEIMSKDNLERLHSLMGDYGFACTPAETPILMADWTTKPISEVRPGDEIVGFEQGTRAARARLVPATVRRAFSKTDTVWDLTMESGRKVRCTADHRWFTGRSPRERNPKSPRFKRRAYNTPAVGRRLMFVCPPADECSEEDRRLWWYLAGIIDGEGHVARSACHISQSPTANPGTFKAIGETLDRLGVKYNLLRVKSANPRWGDRGEYVLRDVDSLYRKLLRFTRPGKRDQIIARMFKHGHMFIRDRDRVLAIESPRAEPVFALETTSGNYIAWGYASSNSLYQQRPVPKSGGMLKHSWWRFWAPKGRLSELGPVVIDGEERPVVELPDEFDSPLVQSWDMNFKKLVKALLHAREPDAVAGLVGARKGAQYFILDRLFGRVGFDETLDMVRELTERNPAAVAKVVEYAANGPDVIAKLRHEIGGFIPNIPIGRKEARVFGAHEAMSDEEMHARAVSMAAALQAGDIYLPHPNYRPFDPRGADAKLRLPWLTGPEDVYPGWPWSMAFIQNVGLFPKDGKDDTDALSQLWAFLYKGEWKDLNRAHHEAMKVKLQPKTVAEAFQEHLRKLTRAEVAPDPSAGPLSIYSR